VKIERRIEINSTKLIYTLLAPGQHQDLFYHWEWFYKRYRYYYCFAF